ncbi:MAG: ATP-grasp domain-containing protein [Candidatus Polarisedimenticolia bacterium]
MSTSLARIVGILYGMERTFPPALAAEIDRRGGGKVAAQLVSVGPVRQDRTAGYDVILDRISHEVPFYRSWLKAEAALGTQVVNNPFWWTVDDKFLDNIIAHRVGVAVPRTVILPHKQHPPNTSSDSFSNLAYPIDWDAVFAYLGFPIFLKPAHGGGWKDVYKVNTPEEFFAAYDRTHTLMMMAQEAIEFREYFRCYVLGRERVRIMPYDPRQPFERRYVQDGAGTDPALLRRVERDAVALCRALGYDFNTVELAVRDGVPYAIDFMNPAPDCDSFSVGPASFEWVVSNAADLLIDRALHPRPLELTGDWTSTAPWPPRPAPTEPLPSTEPGIKGTRGRAPRRAGGRPSARGKS